MAMMSPLQRRKLEDLIRQNPGALAQLVGAQGGTLGALTGAPEGGVNLAEIAGMAPQTKVVSPASPAPVAQGVEVAAPPVQQPRIQMDPTGLQPMARVGLARAQADEEIARAAREAAVPEKVEQALGMREKRIEEGLQEVEEDRKKAGWEALAMAGFKMAQSQSPYFMSALAAGMEAGLTGFNAKKAAAAERKARLQEQQENAVLERQRQIDADRARRLAEAQAGRTIAKDIIGTELAGTQAYITEKTAPYTIKQAELAPQKTQAEIASEYAEAAQKRAYAEALKSGRIGVGAGGNDGTISPNQIQRSIDNANAQILKIDMALADPFLDPNSQAAKNLLANRQGFIERLRQLGASVPSGSTATGGGGGVIGGGSAAAPRPGTIVDGYRFKGGNPADRKNWEKVR